MKCFVCGGEMTPYFTKKIAVEYLDGLDTFEYERCGHCGLVVALPPSEVIAGSFDFLMSSSVFEHLLGNRGDVDKVIGLVKPDGVMGLHTLICEEVPRDPEWHYLLPVHCTLWMNAAMSIVFEKFGFRHCSYNVEAQVCRLLESQAVSDALRS